MKKIFFFPFAGASAYSYNTLVASLDPGIERRVFELPGRGRRISEKLLTDMPSMVDDLCLRLKQEAGNSYSFFGHSMGAILAYLTALRITADGTMPPPAHLFLSGRQAPRIPSKKRSLYDLPLDQLLVDLKELGGIPEEVGESSELMNFLEPIWRADLEALEKYDHRPAEPLKIPVFVMKGMDEDFTLQEADAWREVTSAEFGIRQFQGNHFFIFERAAEVADVIHTHLQLAITT
jgi:surfactin synthase thioesterase subunit